MPLVAPHQINYVTKILCGLQTAYAYEYQRGGRKYFLSQYLSPLLTPKLKTTSLKDSIYSAV